MNVTEKKTESVTDLGDPAQASETRTLWIAQIQSLAPSLRAQMRHRSDRPLSTCFKQARAMEEPARD